MTTITADNLDGLVLQGIGFVRENGIRIDARAQSGIQATNVIYSLTNSQDRILNLRFPASLTYLCQELLAFFKGSLDVNEGLSEASSYWKQLADNNGKINSNYGYYVFRDTTAGVSQFDWVVNLLLERPFTRRALININEKNHKYTDTKDFPCAIGMHFQIEHYRLNCIVYSRSEDLIWGLPYDIGFFSFVNELLWKKVEKLLPFELQLGSTVVVSSFTQIYDNTAHIAEDIFRTAYLENCSNLMMPSIEDAQMVLDDIYNGTFNSNVLDWIKINAKNENDTFRKS